MATGKSLAVSQVSLADPSIQYPLFPPLVEGCPRTSTAEMQIPLAIGYDGQLPDDFFGQAPLPGLGRWQALLPPLAEGLPMGEGGTALVEAPRLAEWAEWGGRLYIKDESRNPTGSHKDRLNLCTVSAATLVDAPGITVASSGNHGAAAAAYATRAGLPCVLFATAGTEPHIIQMLRAYGAAVLPVPREMRRPLMRQLVQRAGFHPVSSITDTHTGHPFGPEGYKTIAYEIYQQLGKRSPAAVLVPTAYAELLYGVWMGFKELRKYGALSDLPQMIACEPAAAAPLGQALALGKPVVHVVERPTAAYSIVVAENSLRGVLAIQESEGEAVAVNDEELLVAQRMLSAVGLWAELSGTAGVAAFKILVDRGLTFDGPVVALMTSTGFKDQGLPLAAAPSPEPTWDGVRQTLRDVYNLTV